MITTGGCKVYRETVTASASGVQAFRNKCKFTRKLLLYTFMQHVFIYNLMNVVFIFSVMSHRFAFDFLTCRIYIYIYNYKEK